MKKILIIVFLIMLIILVFQINYLYALYKDEIEGQFDNSVGKWVIFINEEEITNNNNITEYDITNQYFKYDASENIKNGKIAPGRTGYFDLIIDGTRVQCCHLV